MTNTPRKHLGWLLALPLGLAGAGAGHAEPAALRSDAQSDWTVDLTWWLFAPVSTTGTSTVNGQSAAIDMDLSEALEVLDFSSSLRLEAWNGNVGLIADLNYLGLSEEGGTTVASAPGAPELNARIEAEQSWLNLMAGYRVMQGRNAAGNAYAFDVQGGLRYNRIRQDITISGPMNSIALGGTETWWEPVIGARGIVALNEDWTFAAGADFGGFGVGGNDLAWSATAAFDWSFSDNASLKFGYRYYSIDFGTGSGLDRFEWDIAQHGPFFGLTYAFQ